MSPGSMLSDVLLKALGLDLDGFSLEQHYERLMHPILFHLSLEKSSSMNKSLLFNFNRKLNILM